ncbi:MAG: anion transporter, partial [Planctomycetota bacterium]
MSEKLSKAGDQLRWIALPGAPILAAFAYFTLEPTGLEHEPRAVAAVALWMAMWWMTEAVPLAATSLLPLVLFPLLQVTTMAGA